MPIPREIDNDECRRALRYVHDVGRVVMTDVPEPMETGALLWHGLVEVKDGAFSITERGLQVLAEWEKT